MMTYTHFKIEESFSLGPFTVLSPRQMAGHHMRPGCRKYLEVLYSVICCYVIDMMNKLFLVKESANCLLNYISMLCKISLPCSIWVFWKEQVPVPVTHNRFFSVCNPHTLITTVQARAFWMFRSKFFSTNQARARLFGFASEHPPAFCITGFPVLQDAWKQHRVTTANRTNK